MEMKNVHNDFKNAGNEKQNSLTSGIRIGWGNFSDTDNIMILQELHRDVMKGTINKRPIRWILGIVIIALVSIVTGVSFWWCLLAYVGIMFLIQFSANLIFTLIGIIFIVGVFLALFFGLLTL